MNRNYLYTLLAMFFLPMYANAGGENRFDGICEAFDCVVGNGLVIGIATVAIFFLGIGAFFGKVNWGLVIMVVIAIVVIAGAYQIALLVLGDDFETGSCGDGNCDGIIVQ